MITRLALTPVVLSSAVVGCGTTPAADPTPHPEVTAADAAVRLVDEDDADLVLYVSNQSFDDARARLTVEVDDVTVVVGTFHVEDQHTWVRFPLSLSPGDHEITADSDSGATLRASFDVPGDEKRYAVVEYWNEGGPADLTWSFHRQEIGFA